MYFGFKIKEGKFVNWLCYSVTFFFPRRYFTRKDDVFLYVSFSKQLLQTSECFFLTFGAHYSLYYSPAFCVCFKSQLKVLLPNSIHCSSLLLWVTSVFFFFVCVWTCVLVCVSLWEIWTLLDSFSSFSLWLCAGLRLVAWWVDEMKVYIVLK